MLFESFSEPSQSSLDVERRFYSLLELENEQFKKFYAGLMPLHEVPISLPQFLETQIFRLPEQLG
jgi:hypothetical protein